MRKLALILLIALCSMRAWAPPPSHPSFPLAFFPLTGNQNHCIPAGIDGLMAWYVADDLSTSLAIGASVTSWPDRSGNGNTLTNLVGAASQPILSQSNLQFRAKYTVTFDGGDNLNRTSPIGFAGETGQSIVIVYQHIAGAAGGNFAQLCLTSNGVNEVRLDSVGNQVECMFAGGPGVSRSSSRFSTNGWMVSRFDNTSNLNQGFEDYGIPAAQTDQTDAGTFASSIIRLGSRTDGSLAYIGKIAEIIVYNRRVSDTELNTIFCYLVGRYGF